jgi:hypothetical protein
MLMTAFPPSGFSLIPLGTHKSGHVSAGISMHGTVEDIEPEQPGCSENLMKCD